MRRLLAAVAAALVLLTPAAAWAGNVSASFADTFADPMVVRGDDGYWYAYGTTDPLREGEKMVHRIPIARSADLKRWSYVGDAFTAGQRPAFAAANTAYWAPDVRRAGRHWVMYVTVTETTVAPGASAIGAATAPTPAGPWTFVDRPVVAPRPSGDDGWLWTFDPAQLTTPDGRKFLYYGSYFGGIWVSELSADGLRTVGTATRVAIDNKFEGAYVVRRHGWYYLFASSANCCAGPTTGYSVSVGRSRDPRGPFADRSGQSLNVSRAGGTPVIAPNGNRWVGTGHNGLVTDARGQDWLVYHAIDRGDPYLDEPFGINERPMLIDRLDWIGGWPTVRAGAGASDGPDSGSAWEPRPGRALPAYSDEFRGTGLGGSWAFVRPDPAAVVAGGALRWPVQDADLTGSSNDAGVLLRDAPRGNWIAETRLTLDLGEDSVRNYQQAGLIAYAGDNLFARLSAVAIWNTRQVEFGHEIPYAGSTSYGGNIAGTPGRTTTWLRLAHHVDPRTGEHEYRAGVSRDGRGWTWGGVWTLPPDTTPRVGLVAHGGAAPAVTASFDYLRFSRW
ncbi:family 43 glycosylhydrolase [Pseudosporangium ferrugineum]|uniref:Arabinan endo-1,5-alpha-L-arabinosidase n=1 Tax=Pseudosporangium ferrugineum TaxID=439699 RepID=A0A2T0S4P7_9ACTN|nr:family 43 glycosylhydrolase [Pseudosporangium ferrugineum]PRY28390.1 arabinan endo-1,5-alpha-L-arabinosidase [Pseudosporangium ferrugineum]